LWAVLFVPDFLVRARPLFEFLVRSSGHIRRLYLFILVLPQALPSRFRWACWWVLITLTRMSTDGKSPRCARPGYRDAVWRAYPAI
jgi:hypothetical protein